MHDVSFLANKFQYIHSLFSMLGSVLGASFGVCGVGILCPLGFLTCCPTWVRWPEAGRTGRELHLCPVISRSWRVFPIQNANSLENRGLHLLGVGTAGKGIWDFTPGDKMKAFIQTLSKVRGQ